MFLYSRFKQDDPFRLKEPKKLFGKFIYCIVPSVIVFTCQTIVWMSGGGYATFLERTGGHLYSFIIPSIDYNIPIMLWLVPFYYTILAFFIVWPIVIYFMNGKGALFRTINTCFFVYSTTLILYLILPTSTKILAQHGIKMLDDANAKGWFANITYHALDVNATGLGFSAFHSAFPSMHCSTLSILLMGTFDGFFMDHFIKKKHWSWIRYLICSLFLIYCIFTIISTFSLKQHFFVDWIISVSITIIFWNMWKWLQKIGNMNHWKWVNALENCFDSFGVAYDVTYADKNTFKWCIQTNEKYQKLCITKKQKIKHDIVVIIIDVLAYLLICAPLAITSSVTHP